jgi:UDP-3-O-[3-hydroxymyristoyl] glucosamine N-acyltransferase
VLTRVGLARPGLPVTFVIVEEPQRTFAHIARTRMPSTRFEGISPQAWIHPSARLAEGVVVAPFAVIGPAVQLGRETKVGPHAYLASGVITGEQCDIQARATLMEGVRLGNRVRVFPGAVIGGEGFGLISGPQSLEEMPQIGTVEIADDVRVGSNSSVARGTIGATRLGRGTKIDDLVLIGHNGQLGERCVLCGGASLAGSVRLGNGVVVGGQAGIAQGVHIGDRARLGGAACTSADLKGDETYTFTPAVPVREGHRIYRNWRRLPEIWKRLMRLEKAMGIEAGGEEP